MRRAHRLPARRSGLCASAAATAIISRSASRQHAIISGPIRRYAIRCARLPGHASTSTAWRMAGRRIWYQSTGAPMRSSRPRSSIGRRWMTAAPAESRAAMRRRRLRPRRLPGRSRRFGSHRRQGRVRHSGKTLRRWPIAPGDLILTHHVNRISPRLRRWSVPSGSSGPSGIPSKVI